MTVKDGINLAKGKDIHDLQKQLGFLILGIIVLLVWLLIK